MGKPSAPQAPDYTGAALAQGGANLQSVLASNILNNPTQVTPYGTKHQTQTGQIRIPDAMGSMASGPDIPTFTSQIDLTPLGQHTLDQQQRISSGLADLGEGQLGRVSDAVSKPQDFSSVKDVQDKAYKAITSRLDPQWEQRDKSIEAHLTNQGLRPGMEAWDNAMRDYNNSKNDAYQQANLGAIQTAPQTLQEAQAVRELPLNELTALATGGQVSMPQFSGAGQNGYNPADIAGAAARQAQAANQLYGISAGNYNSMMGGLYSLGGSVASAAPYFTAFA